MDALINQGWKLSQQTVDSLLNENKNKVNLQKMVLNTDMNAAGEKFILNYLQNHQDDMNCVLQISKLKNIAVSSQKQYNTNNHSRMLRLTLTDGHDTCVGVELDAIKDLHINSYPGTKLLVHGKVEVINGILLLSSENVKVLGGHVEHLHNKWKTAKDLLNHDRNENKSSDRPPPFVPFGQTIKSDVEVKRKVMSTGNSDSPEATENVEFDKHRTAAIGEVSSNQQTKNFSQKPQLTKSSGASNNFSRKQNYEKSNVTETSKVTANIYVKDTFGSDNIDKELLQQLEKMGFNKSDTIDALKSSKNNFDFALETLLSLSTSNHEDKKEESRFNKRKGKRGQRDDKEANQSSSGPATLFDFMESKIPAEKAMQNDKSYNRSSSHPSYESPCPSSTGDYYNGQNTLGKSNYNRHNIYNRHKNNHYNKHENRQYAENNLQDRKEHGGEYKREQDGKNPYKNKQIRNNSNYNSYGQGSHTNYYRSENNRKDNGSGLPPKYNKRNLKSSTSYNQDESKNQNIRTFQNSNYNKSGNNSAQSFTKNTNSKFPENKRNSLSQSQIKDKPVIPEMHANLLQFQIGMNCQAKYWDDERFYPAVIKNIHPTAPTAVVLFTEYGNFEEVSFSDILPLQLNEKQLQQNYRQPKPTQSIYVPPSQRK